MRGLEPPPKTETPSKLVARFLTLIIFATAAGVAVYTAVTNQTADVAEDIRPVNLELADTTVIDGVRTNVRVDEGGPTPVVILHDDDVTGGLTLDGLAAGLGDDYHGVRLDLPGFGFSSRMPAEGSHHTVAGLAELVAPVLEERFSGPVHVVGVGLGGEVAAELALTSSDLVAGVVLVDVDFWSQGSFTDGLQGLPWVGRAATYTWETGGRYALTEWAPYCDDGGWCPTSEEASVRSVIVEIERTTDSFNAFRRTNDAALAPANLADITVPMAYVHSTDGQVDQAAIDRILEAKPGVEVFESDTFQAHQEDVDTVAQALAAVAG